MHIKALISSEIKDKEDTLKLQRDIDRLGNWARKWGMRFQPVKCNMMQLTNKTLNKIQASYTLEGTVLENVDNINYVLIANINHLYSIEILNISLAHYTKNLSQPRFCKVRNNS